jgi:hypothetical protein
MTIPAAPGIRSGETLFVLKNPTPFFLRQIATKQRTRLGKSALTRLRVRISTPRESAIRITGPDVPHKTAAVIVQNNPRNII